MTRPVTHRSLDGRRVVLSGNLDLTRPWTSVARVAVHGRIHELTSGTPDFAASWTRDLGVRADEEFRLRRGRLRLGRAVHRDRAMKLTDHLLAAVWAGRRHVVTTPLYHARSADAIRLFDTLDVHEYADGVTVAQPPTVSARHQDRRRHVTFTEPVEVIKEIPELGLLQITALDRWTLRRLPPWPGVRLPGGELFRDTLGAEGSYFVLAAPTAIVTVLPPAGTAERVPDQLSELTVEARGGGGTGTPPGDVPGTAGG